MSVNAETERLDNTINSIEFMYTRIMYDDNVEEYFIVKKINNNPKSTVTIKKRKQDVVEDAHHFLRTLIRQRI